MKRPSPYKTVPAGSVSEIRDATEVKPSSRKKLCLISVSVSLIVIISVVLAVVLTRDSPVLESNPYQKYNLIFRRYFNVGAQDTYAVNSRSEIVMGANSTEAIKQQTLQATVQLLNDGRILLNFVLVEGNATLSFLSDSSFRTPSNQEEDVEDDIQGNSTSDSLSVMLQEMDLSVIICEIMITGKVNYCLKPSYLAWDEFEFMLTLVDQLSPILEKKYFESTRLLEGSETQQNDDYVESRKFTFSGDEPNNTVSVKNSYQNTNNSGSLDYNGTSKYSMSTEIQMDANTGQILNSQQSSKINMLAAQGDEDEIIKLMNVNSTTDLNLVGSATAEAAFMDFMTQVFSLEDLFVNVSNPLVNKTLLQSANQATPLEETQSQENTTINGTDFNFNDTSNETGLVLYDATQAGGMRLLIAGDKAIILAKHNLFQKSILGGKLITYIELLCYDNDQCSFEVVANLFGLEITLYEKHFEFSVSRVAKVYRYVKIKVLNQVKNITSLIKKDLSLLVKLADELNSQVTNLVPSLLTPIESVANQLKATAFNLESQLQNFDVLHLPINQIAGGILREVVYKLKTYYTTSVSDLSYFNISLQAVSMNLQIELQNNFLDTARAKIITDYLQDFQISMEAYYLGRRAELSTFAGILNNSLNAITEKIDSAWLGINEVQELLQPVIDGLKTQFDLLNQQTLQAFSLYVEDAIVKFDMEYMDALDQFRKLQEDALNIINSRKTSNSGQLSSGFLNQVEQNFTSENLQDIFFTTSLGFNLRQEFSDSLKNALGTAAQGLLAGVKQFSAYSKDVFYKNVTSLLKNSTQDIINQFKNIGVNISKEITNTFTALVTGFDNIYQQARDLTKKEYEPSVDMASDNQAIDLFGVVDEFKQVFDDVETVSTSFKKLQDISHPVQAIQSSNTLLSSHSETVKNTSEKISKSFTKLKDNFKINLDPFQFDFSSLKNIIQTSIDTVKDEAVRILKDNIKTKALSFAENQLKQAIGLKNLLLEKLNIALPTVVLQDISVFDKKKSIVQCVPVPPVLVCARGTFRAFMRIPFSFGLSNGLLFFKIEPQGQAEIELDGFVKLSIIEAGAYLKGILFQGRLPILMALDYQRSRNLKFTVDFYLIPFSFEAGIYVDYRWFSCKWVKKKKWRIRIRYWRCSLSWRRKVLWKIYEPGTAIHKSVANKTIALK